MLYWLPPLRRAFDPFLAAYYALPHFAFYPLLIVIFGLGSLPLIVLATLFAMVAMIVATLAGLDRVPRVLIKTARMHAPVAVRRRSGTSACRPPRRTSSPG